MNKRVLMSVLVIVILLGVISILVFTNKETSKEYIDNNQNPNETNNQGEINNQDNTGGASVILKVNDKEIEIILYDTEVSKDILSRLPYRVTVNNSGIDLCGDAGNDIKLNDAETTRQSYAGDIMYIKNGNYFSIFLIDYNNQNDAYKIGRIKNKEDIEYLQDNVSTVTIEIIQNTN